jgi:class 3 adenylate cyclase
MYTGRDETGWINLTPDEADLKRITKLALQSSFALHRAFTGDVVWKIHSGISVGAVKLVQVGGFRNRLEFLAIGPCLTSACLALEYASHSQTSVPQCVVDLLADDPRIIFSLIPDDNKKKHHGDTDKYYILEKASKFDEFDQKKSIVEFIRDDVVPDDVVALNSMGEWFSAFVPEIIIRRLSTSDLSSSLAEVRTVTTVFVEILLHSKQSSVGDHPETPTTTKENLTRTGSLIFGANETPSFRLNSNARIKSGSSKDKDAKDGKEGSMKSKMKAAVKAKAQMARQRSALSLDANAGIQTIFVAIQKVIEEYKGMLRQLIIDDKGCVLITIFGSHGSAGLQVATSAITAAFKIKQRAISFRTETHVGITTGSVFCGTVGTPKRREYAAIGGPVNMAARLMGMHRKDMVLVDKPTMEDSRESFEFSHVDTVSLKGIKDPVEVFSPKETDADNNAKPVFGPPFFVGHKDIKSTISLTLSSMKYDSKGGLYILYGDPGIGKTALAKHLVHVFNRNYQVATFYGSSDQENRHTDYFAFRAIISNILNIHLYDFSTVSAQQASIALIAQKIHQDAYLYQMYKARKTTLGGTSKDYKGVDENLTSKYITEDQYSSSESDDDGAIPEEPSTTVPGDSGSDHVHIDTALTESRILDLLPIMLKVVLDIDIKSTQGDANLISERTSKAAEILALVEYILTSFGIMTIVIDDAQWLDTLSLQLIINLTSHPQILVTLMVSTKFEIHARLAKVINYNPSKEEEEARPTNIALGGTRDTPYEKPVILSMHTLQSEEVSALLCQSFNMSTCPEAIINHIMELAKGHPLHSLEVFRFLRTKGILYIENGVCQLRATDGADLDTAKTSLGKIDTLILSRLDDLSGELQETLMPASVIGEQFTIEILQAIVPLCLSRDKGKLELILDKLCDKGFLLVHHGHARSLFSSLHGGNKTTYRFDNNLTRSVIYEVTPPQKRIQIHRKVAQKIESLFSDDLESVFTLLSYHYREAQEKEKSLKFLEQSIKSCLHQGFHEKVVEGIIQALKLGQACAMTEFEGIDDPVRKMIQWEYQAYISLSILGNYTEATKYKKSALKRLDGDETRLKAIPRLLPHSTERTRRHAIALNPASSLSLTEALLSANPGIASAMNNSGTTQICTIC